MDQVEKYIMTRLYKSVFCPETSDDEKKDLATQNRIRWVFEAPWRPSVPDVLLLGLLCVAGLFTGSPSRCCACRWMKNFLTSLRTCSKP